MQTFETMHTVNVTCPLEPGIKGIFELVKANPKLEITALVAACPDTCKLVLGLGNPDISGIGVMLPTATNR